MKPLSYDDARLVPVVSDSDVQARVADLVGRARSRQVWFLFLDRDNVQLPLLMPIDGHPATPSADDTEWMAERIRQLCEACDAASMILVIERYASAALTPQDVAWAMALHDACDRAQTPLRALMLSHRTGVRWIAQDDYRFGA
jgi:hypothetical protein